MYIKTKLFNPLHISELLPVVLSLTLLALLHTLPVRCIVSLEEYLRAQ